MPSLPTFPLCHMRVVNCRFVIASASVIINDITAYICGRLFGRTPLTVLSPKKTWYAARVNGSPFVARFVTRVVFVAFGRRCLFFFFLDEKHLWRMASVARSRCVNGFASRLFTVYDTR